MADKQTPPDWVLLEAAKRARHEYTLDFIRNNYDTFSSSFRALCDMIEKYEQPPVDRKLLCAREAHNELSGKAGLSYSPTSLAVRAIELWEEGFGK
jgi:hypothetical protein